VTMDSQSLLMLRRSLLMSRRTQHVVGPYMPAAGSLAFPHAPSVLPLATCTRSLVSCAISCPQVCGQLALVF
jgi:hypothetical protein